MWRVQNPEFIKKKSAVSYYNQMFSNCFENTQIQVNIVVLKKEISKYNLT
jgi:hypothetical protein